MIVVLSDDEYDGVPSNGLPLSCAAAIDRERDRVESSFQNRPDLARRAAASATAPCWAAALLMRKLRYHCGLFRTITRLFLYVQDEA